MGRRNIILLHKLGIKNFKTLIHVRFLTDTKASKENTYPAQVQTEVAGFTSFDKGPSFSFPDFEIDGKNKKSLSKWDSKNLSDNFES